MRRFVLEVANLGQEVIASFTRFITTRKIQERRLENTLATLSITTSILTDLGTTINKFNKDAYIEDEVTRPTCETCKADFETLLVISNEAGERGIWVREGTLGGKPVSAEIDPWFLFNVGLGGPAQSAEFFNRLDATRYSLVALTDTVKYKIFKVLKEQDRLDPEQTEEFKSLTALLPQLVKTIERAERSKKERLVWEAEKEKERQRALKSSRNRPDVGQSVEVPLPDLEPKISDTASEVTVIEPDQPTSDDPKKRKVQFTVDDDRCSFYSIDDCLEDREFLDSSEEVLEEWLLRFTEPKKELRGGISFLGLSLKRFDEDGGFWGIDPELRSQNELQDALHALISRVSEAKYRASVEKAMRALPADARETVECLLEDRERNTSNYKFTRTWSVVAVRPKMKYHFGGEGLFKSAKRQDWLIMIKGQTLDQAKRKRPTRWEDPWRKPYEPVHRRSRRPHYPRIIEENYYGRDYPRIMPRPRSPVDIRPLSPLPFVEDHRHRQLTRDAEIDGFRPGTIVVGEVSNHEEAEKKMNEILTDLPNKLTV